MIKQSKDTSKVRQMRPDKAVRIEPLEGWTVQTQYGTLRLSDGTDCVRLEDVHSWMCSNGAASASAVRKIFVPLLDEAQAVCGGDADAGRILKSLRLARASDPSVPVFVAKDQCTWHVDRHKCENMKPVQFVRMASGVRRVVNDGWIERYVPHVTASKDKNVTFFATGFPKLGHVHCEDGTVAGLVYAIAEGAMRVWNGPADLRTDFLAVHDRSKEAESDQHYGIKWPKDEVLRTLLARLAVPIPVAHELWGWGRVVADQVEAAPADPMAKDVGTLGKKTRYDWKGNQTLYCKLQSDFDAAEGATVKARHEAVAAEWGISPAMVKKALQEGKKRASAAKQKKASPFPW